MDQGRASLPRLRERRGHASRFYRYQGVYGEGGRGGGVVVGAENAMVVGAVSGRGGKKAVKCRFPSLREA
jgi:hypothetical protein